MKIYVACLASYNAGHLFGEWINLENINNIEELETSVNNMLKKSPIINAESFAVHDYDDFPNLGEYPSFKKIMEVVEFLNQDTETKQGAARVALSKHLNNVEYAQDMLDRDYDVEEVKIHFAYNYFNGLAIPDEVEFYINHEAILRDLEINYTILYDTKTKQYYKFF